MAFVTYIKNSFDFVVLEDTIWAIKQQEKESKILFQSILTIQNLFLLFFVWIEENLLFPFTENFNSNKLLQIQKEKFFE